MSLGNDVVGALVRRLRGSARFDTDLLLVCDHPVLEDLDGTGDVLGHTWRFGRVTGEFTLRDALPDGDKLVAVVPASFDVPLDIQGRTWLGQPLRVEARDVVSGLARRPCEALGEELASAVTADLAAVRSIRNWTLDTVVTARDVRQVLLKAQLGTVERLDRLRGYKLLAQWLVEGPPRPTDPGLVRRALDDALGVDGRLLGTALEPQGLARLLACGALCDAAPAEATRLLSAARGHRSRVVVLVRDAVQEALGQAPSRVRALLQSVEENLDTDVVTNPELAPLLVGPARAALEAHALALCHGRLFDDVAVEGLLGNLHVELLEHDISAVRQAGRLARAMRALATESLPTRASDWLSAAEGLALVDHAAWMDRALRDLRRELPRATDAIRQALTPLINQVVEHRSACNRAFATALAEDWPRVTANRDPREPLLLSRVGQQVVQPLLRAGHHVLLLVLDGCDRSIFFELMDALPPESKLVVRSSVPQLSGAARDQVGGVAKVGFALSPIPTVTTHARRALFAGRVPGESELHGKSDPSSDPVAFRAHTALGDAPRSLFLKGDLGPGGEHLRAALSERSVQLVAAVLNGVDDSLSSKETAAPAPWTWDRIGVDGRSILETAVAHEWTVLITADHGHTPYVLPSQKVRLKGDGPRVVHEDGAGVVTFRKGPLPSAEVRVLVDYGAWRGGQHRGWHGGAGIEEVVVPFAFVGRPDPDQAGGLSAPVWWWRTPTASVTEEATIEVTPSAPAPAPSTWLDGISDGRVRQALDHIAAHGSLSFSELYGMFGRRARRVGTALVAAADAAPFALRVEQRGDQKWYVRGDER